MLLHVLHFGSLNEVTVLECDKFASPSYLECHLILSLTESE